VSHKDPVNGHAAPLRGRRVRRSLRRIQLRFTPTYSSWVSQVGWWFAELQRRCLDRGMFCSSMS
jgi:hypothetical protein